MSGQQKKLNTISIILITVILPVIVIAISSVAIFFTARSAAEQKNFDISLLDSLPPVIEAVPEKAEDAEKLTEKLFEDAVACGLLKYTGNVSVNFEEVKAEKESIGTVLAFAAPSMSGKCTEMYEPVSIKYGEDASHILSLLPGSAPDDFTAEINEGILTLTMNYDSVFDNMYFLNDDTAAVKMFKLANSAVFSSGSNERFIPELCVFTLTADCREGKLISYNVKRIYNYSSYITFKDTLADMGTTAFEMKPVFTENYDFSYAGISIEQEQLTLTKNGFEALTVTPFVEEGLSEDEFTLEFISSDPNVATVDENGQVEAVSISDKPVEITVKLNYLGKDFSDSCTVYVVKEVESVKISETGLSLRVGEEAALTAEVRPDDATVKDVEYYSFDESVVKVTSDGKLTAVGEGTAVVAVISLQGLISSECTVTVTG